MIYFDNLKENVKKLNEDVTGNWGDLKNTFYDIYLPAGNSVKAEIQYVNGDFTN